jgi:hypothetical protein
MCPDGLCTRSVAYQIGRLRSSISVHAPCGLVAEQVTCMRLAWNVRYLLQHQDVIFEKAKQVA